MRRLAIVGSFIAATAVGFLIVSSGVLVIRGEEVSFRNGDVRLAGTLALPRWGKGPFPAVVVVHGSGQVQRRNLRGIARFLTPRGIAVLMYDKRGVGQSTGSYPRFSVDECAELFRTLAGDTVAAVEYLAARPDIDRERIGLSGGSQAGWIMPIVATLSDDVSFLIAISGPAVTCGEENLFSQLTGDDPGPYENLSEEEIERRMRAFGGPHGYDPVPVLKQLTVPSLWILGGRDRSVPTAITVANLERLRADGNEGITVELYSEGDHSLRHADTGRRIDYRDDVIHWLRQQGILDDEGEGNP